MFTLPLKILIFLLKWWKFLRDSWWIKNKFPQHILHCFYDKRPLFGKYVAKKEARTSLSFILLLYYFSLWGECLFALTLCSLCKCWGKTFAVNTYSRRLGTRFSHKILLFIWIAIKEVLRTQVFGFLLKILWLISFFF